MQWCKTTVICIRLYRAFKVSNKDFRHRAKHLVCNRPTPAVTDKHMLCVNFTWLGINIFQLQLELYSSALGEVSQILLIDRWIKDSDLASTVLSTSLGKTFFFFFFYCFFFFFFLIAWCIILNEKGFGLTDHILSDTICLLVCFILKYFPKIRFMAKNKEAISVVKCLFGFFVQDFFFSFSLLNLNY